MHIPTSLDVLFTFFMILQLHLLNDLVLISHGEHGLHSVNGCRRPTYIRDSTMGVVLKTVNHEGVRLDVVIGPQACLYENELDLLHSNADRRQSEWLVF